MHRLRYQDSRLTQTVRSGQGRNFASSHGEPEAGTHPTHNWDFRGVDGVKISLFGTPWQGWQCPPCGRSRLSAIGRGWFQLNSV